MLTERQKMMLENAREKLIVLYRQLNYVSICDIASHIDTIIHEIDKKLETQEVKQGN